MPGSAESLNVAAAVVLNGLSAEIAAAEDLLVPGTPRHDFLRGTAVRAAVFLVSIPIAYGISESWAKWSWLLLLVLPRISRLRRRD